MKKFAMAAAAIGALAASLLVGVAPTSAATAPTGYVVVENEGGCELQQLDLVTGLLTDLPAAPSVDACSVDLAVTTAGVVHGIAQTGEGEVSLITYAADGTASATAISVAGDDTFGLADGGIAISAGGTIYVQLVAGIPGCDTGSPDDTLVDEVAPLYEGDSVCLFTLDAGSGVATIIGTTGLFETYFLDLTSCASGLITQFVDSELGAFVWATESTSTGEATPTVVSETPLGGYDCPSTSDTLYAVSTAEVLRGTAQPSALIPGVGTVNTATGVYSETAALSDPEANVIALGVTPIAVDDDVAQAERSRRPSPADPPHTLNDPTGAWRHGATPPSRASRLRRRACRRRGSGGSTARRGESATMAARYSSQSGCSPCIARYISTSSSTVASSGAAATGLRSASPSSTT